MPKLLPRPEEQKHHTILCNIEDCLKRQNINKEKLRLVLGVSPPTLNKCLKNPEHFKLGQLEVIARLGKVQLVDLFNMDRG